MSWSFTATVDTTRENYEEEFYDIEVPTNEDVEGLKKAQDQQVKWVKETVIDAIDCGVVGAENNIFNITGSGHANPDHKPRSGWANDLVTVTIAQQAEPVRV